MRQLKVRAGVLPWVVYAYVYIISFNEYINVKGVANTDESLLFATVFVVLWIERQSIIASFKEDFLGYPLYGLISLCFGLIVYIAGRIYPLIYLEIWGFFLVASGMIITFASRQYIKSAIFVSVAGTVLVVLGRVAPELLSSELAKAIASISANILNSTLFPVTSNGVTLYFGPYSAEVVHACSGMNSIFSLLALSVIYLRQGVRRNYWHIAALVAIVIPVAVFANLLRVIFLVMITWYFGSRYAQSLYHDLTGIVVFVIALLFLAGFDQFIFKINKKQ